MCERPIKRRIPKIWKNRDFDFLTDSERFLADFEKKTIFRFFEKFSKNYENCQTSLKSDISDTNGYRKRDFRLEASQNDTLKVDFRPTGTHFLQNS